MFESFKKKLSSWVKTSTKTLKKTLKIEKPVKPKIEKAKKENSQERKITARILKDIKKQGLEIKTPEERFEEIVHVEEEKEKKSFFSRIFSKISTFKITEEYFEEMFTNLELILLENNVALEAVEFLREKLKKQLIEKEIKKEDLEQEIKSALKNAIQEMLIPPFNLIEKIKEKQGTFTILFFGINGSGKTTTIAKIANLLKKNDI